jgi:hypothetical protein
MKKLTRPLGKITSKQFRTHQRGTRFIENGFNVFTASSVGNVADEWFNANEVYGLKFKSKTWSNVKRLAAKTDIAALHAMFGPACEIKYSRTAGCSCGCSPGYTVRKCKDSGNHDLHNHDVFVSLNTNDEAKELKKNFGKFNEMLAKEIKTHA